jgi:hypothetical protein
MSAVKDELQRLANEGGGRLTADVVVASARSAKSPIHDQFEWDDKKAGRAHRLYQARQLIRSVKLNVSVEERSFVIPAYVRDPSAEANEQGYVATPKLRTDADAARDAVAAEFMRASNALRRARTLARYLGEDAAFTIDRAIGTVTQAAAELGA